MKRLLDDPAVPSELRAELSRSRRAGEDYDVLAKLPQLKAALAAPQASADARAQQAGPAAGSKPLLAASAWKLTLLAATFGGLAAVFAGLSAGRRAPQPPASTPPATQPAAAPAATPTAPPVAAPQPQPRAAAPASAPQEAAADEPMVTAPVASPARQKSSSRREIAELVRIRALLERDPAAAYRLARRCEREFPQGVLSEERQALQVLALAKQGSLPAARRKAREFFQRHPQSPMRELIEATVRRQANRASSESLRP